MILFNAVPVIELDGCMQSQHWSTPRGAPIGLAGVYALLWIGFAPTLAAVLGWVRFVEGRSLAPKKMGGRELSALNSLRLLALWSRPFPRVQ